MIQSCNWLGNSAEVSLIPVLHEPVQPGATIFIWRLEAVCMSSLFPADLFLAWFIHRAARHDYLENFLSFIARFYALPLDLTDFSKPHVQYNSTPSTSLILQPLEYTTLLRYSHIPNIHRKTSHTPSTTTPKYTLPQRLVLQSNSFNTETEGAYKVSVLTGCLRKLGVREN